LSDIEKVRRLILKAIYQNEFLSQLLVLKGGTALKLYGITNRYSFDIDVSLFELPSHEGFEKILEVEFKSALEQVFEIEENYKIIYFNFERRPQKLGSHQDRNWGGYRVEFKIVPKKDYNIAFLKYKLDEERFNKALHGTYQKIFKTAQPLRIDISKNEYIKNPEEKEIDGVVIKIYTPEMLLFEKLRAICQQMDEYPKRRRKSKNRARDFFDIYLIDKKYSIMADFPKNKNKQNLLKCIFEAKEVKIELLGLIEKYKENYKQNWNSLLETLPASEEQNYPNEFEFYFDYVLKIAKSILNTLTQH